MSQIEEEGFEGGRLFNLYTRYVTEPESRRDVYGYTILFSGYVLGLVGLLVYIVGPTEGTRNQMLFLFREISFTLAGVGLIVTLFGIVIMLPVRRRGVIVAALGTAMGLGAAGWFVTAYPQNWAFGTPDYSSSIVSLYTVSIAIVGGIVVMLPIATGERSYFSAAREVLGSGHPDIMIGEADQAGHFTVYRQARDWTWRLIDEAAIASSADGFLSKLETQERVDRIKEKVEEAGLLEITHAAFRLYQSGEEGWRWLLMQENGTVVAEAAEEYPSRQASENSVNDLKELGPAAELFTIEEAALETYPANGSWRWRFIDGQRQTLAEAPDRSEFRDEARSAAEIFASRAASAPVFTLEQYGVELFEEGGQWQWRVLDPELETLGTGTRSYGSKGQVEDAAYDLLERLGNAEHLAGDEPSYDVYEPAAGEWHWRLVTPEGRTVATGTDQGSSAGQTRQTVESFKTNADGAEAVELPDQEFELYKAGGAWHWRLVDERRNVRAHSVDEYDSRSEAADALEHLRANVPDADLIEFERSAFQIYESDEGQWRWRLIDEDGNVLADSSEGEYESKDGAMGAMSTIRDYAPDAEQLEIENAAFELFEEDGEWGWRLVDDIGDTLAKGTRRYDSRDDAEEDMDALRDEVSGVEVRVMDNGFFQVYHDETDTWWWRFILPDGSIIATAPDGFGTRHEAEDSVETLLAEHVDAGVTTVGSLAVLIDPVGGRWSWKLVDHDRDAIAEASAPADSRQAAKETASSIQAAAADVTVFEIREAAFLVTDGDEWQWVLLDEDHDPIGTSSESYSSADASEDAVGTVSELAADVEFIDYDDAAFELFETEAGWEWQLIDEQRTVVADGAETYDSRRDVETAVEAIRAELPEASILEIERAAFEFHEGDEGWRWRLIDETGNELAESLQSYPSRAAAREAMNTVKAFAPEARVSVAD